MVCNIYKKSTRIIASLICGCIIIHACKKDDDGDKPKPPVKPVVEYFAPVNVNKSVNTKIYAHYMPWFETPETNDGKWGQHWTMANKSPDVIDANGKRSIASHFYPLIGPYASSDKHVIQYQLLLMKLSGIDGVLIDWPTTIDLYDYPKNLSNAEALIEHISEVGLKYAIVYEDHNVKIAFDQKKISNKLAAAQNDMSYLKINYFTDTSYINIDNRPLLLVFGPQTFFAGADWVSIFTALNPKPVFLTLWNQSGQAGTAAGGEYSWVWQDNGSNHLTFLTNFYTKSFSGIKMGSAYPGFKTFYNEGGWGGPTFEINHNGTETFATTLQKALDSKVDYIQLVTWNDYGEGTMIEPTREFEYTFLTTLQTKLGVSNNEYDLELVNKMYELRKKYVDIASIQESLDQVYYYMVSLQLDKAAFSLDSISNIQLNK